MQLSSTAAGLLILPRKSLSLLPLELKEQFPGAKIVLAGCLAQRYGRDMELPEADAMAGNRNLDSVIQALQALETETRPVVYAGWRYPGDREGCGFYPARVQLL